MPGIVAPPGSGEAPERLLGAEEMAEVDPGGGGPVGGDAGGAEAERSGSLGDGGDHAQAAVHVAANDLDRAEPLLVRALGITERLRGPSHPELAGNLNNLAKLHFKRGDMTQAE